MQPFQGPPDVIGTLHATNHAAGTRVRARNMPHEVMLHAGSSHCRSVYCLDDCCLHLASAMHNTRGSWWMHPAQQLAGHSCCSLSSCQHCSSSGRLPQRLLSGNVPHAKPAGWGSILQYLRCVHVGTDPQKDMSTAAATTGQQGRRSYILEQHTFKVIRCITRNKAEHLTLFPAAVARSQTGSVCDTCNMCSSALNDEPKLFPLACRTLCNAC